MKTSFAVTAFVLTLSTSPVFAADIDYVFRANDAKGVAGQITTANKTEVVVTQKVGNKEEHIPANEIERVEFQGEPPVLSLAKSNETAGRLDDALAGYQEALSAAGSNDKLKGEIEFLIGRTLARMSQGDPSKLAPALEKLNAFGNAYRDHYRYFPAQLVLAETALQAHENVTAESAFDRLQQSPWPDYQMAGKNGMGRSLLAQDKVTEAKAIFDQVAETKTKTPAEKMRQLQARLGQSECLFRSKQIDPAIDVLKKVIDEASAEDTQVLSQAYIQLGDAYSIDGQHMKDAVLAYLHIDVIPTLATQPNLHAEALYNLTKLWPAIGQPARGAEASARLQQQYPESEWTKKLAEGQ